MCLLSLNEADVHKYRHHMGNTEEALKKISPQISGCNSDTYVKIAIMDWNSSHSRHYLVKPQCWHHHIDQKETTFQSGNQHFIISAPSTCVN